jgi:glutamate decarboxylase
MEVPMHVDAASGGFVFPFSDPDFEWDFRLKSVKSINTSGHKFGLVYPGIGWLVFRDDDQLPDDLVFYEDYLGEKDPTFTLNVSGSSSFILAQYFNFMRLGKSGYGQLVGVMNHNRATLSEAIEATGSLELVRGSGPVIPLVICKVKEGEVFTENELVAELARRRGWLVPAYQMPPDNEDQRIIRMLVKVNQTRELVEALANDFTDSIEMLKTRGPVSHGPPPSHSATGY